MSNSYSKSSQLLAEFMNIEETQLQFEEAFNRNFPIEPVYINQKCDEELYNSLFYIKKEMVRLSAEIHFPIRSLKIDLVSCGALTLLS